MEGGNGHRESGGARRGGSARDFFPRVYDDLRALAALYIKRERAGHTLQPTALVHEAFLRLTAGGDGAWTSEREFIAIAAGAMRRVLVDHARRRDAAKRGGGHRGLTIDSAMSGLVGGTSTAGIDVLILDEAMTRLEQFFPRQSRLVELRVFGGLTVDEAAELIGVAPSTAYKDWEMARAWLLRELGG